MPILIAAILLAMLLAMALLRRRQLPLADLLEHSRTLIDRNLPLVAGLESAALAHTGKSRWSMRLVARQLSKGVPFAAAVRGVYKWNLLALEATLLEMGEVRGTLGRTLELLARHRRAGRPPATQLYLGIYVLGTLSLLTMLCFFVLPKFESIFMDFDMELDHQWFWAVALHVPWLAIGFWILMGVAAILWIRPIRRRPRWPMLWSRVADHVRWHFPIFGREHRWRQWGLALESVSMLLAAGLDLPDALADVAELDLNLRLRRRLRVWAERTGDGESLGKCPGYPQVPHLARWFIDGGLQTGELAEAFARAGDYCTNRRSHAAGIARGVLAGLAITAIVVALSAVCLVVISAEVRLIESVS